MFLTLLQSTSEDEKRTSIASCGGLLFRPHSLLSRLSVFLGDTYQDWWIKGKLHHYDLGSTTPKNCRPARIALLWFPQKTIRGTKTSPVFSDILSPTVLGGWKMARERAMKTHSLVEEGTMLPLTKTGPPRGEDYSRWDENEAFDCCSTLLRSH